MAPSIEQAVSIHLAGRLDDAEHAYRSVLDSDAANITALKGLGTVLLQSQRFEDAFECLRTARNLAPDDPDVLNNLATAALQCGRLDEAQDYLKQVLALAPSHSLAQANLGVVLYRANDLEGSLVSLESALKTDPKNAETYFSHGQTLRALGRFDEAAAAAKRAIALMPSHVNARIDLAATLAAQDNRSDAIATYREALGVHANAAVAHHNLAHLLLQDGQFDEGWAEFDWRWQTADFCNSAFFTDLPAWDGQALDQGTLLVWSEQGIGDEILFANMVPELKDKAPNVVVACSPRLVPLFKRSFPWAEIVAQPDIIDDREKRSRISAQVPSGNLGHFLRPSFGSFPNHFGYLKADASLVSKIKNQLESEHDSKARVGVSWRSSNPKSGSEKSLELFELAPLLTHDRTAFIDLQYGDSHSAREALARESGIHLHHDDGIDPLQNLDAFAAQAVSLDLVITVSNSTAHIAGALGVPCWVLLPAGAGLRWYWFLDRDDSPWYPSLRLFRQATPGDWAPVLQQVKEALSSFRATESGSV